MKTKKNVRSTIKPFNISQDKPRWNKLKIISIVVVFIFMAIVTIGLLKWHNYKSNFILLTPEQITQTKTIALNDLQAHGNDPTQYDLKVASKMRIMNKETPARMISQAYFINSTTQQFYLIDLNSSKVIMHSETNYYEPMQMMKKHDKEGNKEKNETDDNDKNENEKENQEENHPPRWFHMGMKW